jgi:hypothetical protein
VRIIATITKTPNDDIAIATINNGFHEGRDAVLIIMLKTITSRHMTSPLRTLLDSTSYLPYKKGVGEDLFWKAVTEGVRKPIGHSPISEL